MSDLPNHKEKHSKRIHRNIHAKRLRQEREYLPKVIKNKTRKVRSRLSPHDIERLIDDEYDTTSDDRN